MIAVTKFIELLVYYKMSFKNVRSIFDVFKIFKLFLRVPDLTITTSNTAETNYKDYFRFVLFQLYLLFFMYTFYNDKSIFLSTGSHILNAGLALLLEFGTLIAFIVRMEFFIKRYCIWEIILKLNEYDQHVRMSFKDSLTLFQLQMLPDFFILQLTTMGIKINYQKRTIIMVSFILLSYSFIIIYVIALYALFPDAKFLLYFSQFLIMMLFLMGLLQPAFMILIIFQRLDCLSQCFR